MCVSNYIIENSLLSLTAQNATINSFLRPKYFNDEPPGDVIMMIILKKKTMYNVSLYLLSSDYNHARTNILKQFDIKRHTKVYFVHSEMHTQQFNVNFHRPDMQNGKYTLILSILF